MRGNIQEIVSVPIVSPIVSPHCFPNAAGYRGGGMYANAAIAYGTLLIENNFVQGNTASNSGCGICIVILPRFCGHPSYAA